MASSSSSSSPDVVPAADPWETLPSATKTKKAFDMPAVITAITEAIRKAKKRSYDVDISNILLESTTSLNTLKVLQGVVEAGLASKKYKTSCKGFESVIEEDGDIVAQHNVDEDDDYEAYAFMVDWSGTPETK